MSAKQIFASTGTLVLAAGLSLSACSFGSATQQQQLASALVGTTNQEGVSVVSGTVGTMCVDTTFGVGSDGCAINPPSSVLSLWKDPGHTTVSLGEIKLSDGQQFAVSITVDANGNIQWQRTNG